MSRKINSNITILAGICLALFYFRIAFAEPLTVILNAPANKHKPSRINVAGNFNAWQMTDQHLMAWQVEALAYKFTLPHTGTVRLFNLYKDGDWQNPIATEFGKPSTCGFLVAPDGSGELAADFHGWAKETANNAYDTTTGHLITVADFAMPQLKRNGDIYIHLPKSYQTNVDMHYPIIYMLDGQNLFTEALSFSYEWQVDEIVNEMSLELIVVGISNGPDRWQEYNPWDTVDFMGNQIHGSGKQTIEFIKHTLKPYIDSNYRTRHSAEHTAILGSSLGGLMALYAAMEHSDTFGKAAAFSPSFSFTNVDAQKTLSPKQSQLIKAAQKAIAKTSTKVYFDMGEVEYGDFTLVDALQASLLSTGYAEHQLKLVKDKMGRHCEKDWSRRLPGALEWLFSQSP